MNADMLIAEAKANRTGDIDGRRIDAEHLAGLLRFALDNLLSDLDYHSDREANAAPSARLLAVAIGYIEDIVNNRAEPYELARS